MTDIAISDWVYAHHAQYTYKHTCKQSKLLDQNALCREEPNILTNSTWTAVDSCQDFLK